MRLLNILKTLFVPREQEITYSFNVSTGNVNRYVLGDETVNITLREVRVFNIENPRLTSRDVILNMNNVVGIVYDATLVTGILYIISAVSRQSEETLKLNSEVHELLDNAFKDDHAKTFTLIVKGKGDKIKDLKSKTGLEVIKHVIVNKLDYEFKEI